MKLCMRICKSRASFIGLTFCSTDLRLSQAYVVGGIMVRVPVGRASRSLPRTLWFAFLAGIFSCVGLPAARAQAPSATPQAAQAPPADTSQNAPKPDAKAANDEIASHDSPATFKVR